MDWKDAADTQTVCYCQNIDKGTIVTAIQAGNNSLAKVKESTSACTGGNCKELNPSGKCCSGDIQELIRLFSENPDDEDSSSCCCCNSKK